MQLLHTSWLFALAALAIPLIIHLWNIRQGKVLKVGSTSLFTAAAKTSSRSLNLTDILLLLIRCLLLALIALLLSWPVWQKQVTTAKAKGWILLPQETVPETYRQFKPQIDSLQKAGFELHEFNSGFKLIDSVALKKAIQTSQVNKATNISNYWALIIQLNGRVDAATPVYLFTPRQLRHFRGTKPAVDLNLHWQTYTPADSVNTWIEKAWLTTDNNIRVILGHSRPAGTTYSYANISNSPAANSPYTVETHNGKLSIALKGGSDKPVEVNTSPLNIAIYTDVNSADAGYLKAALQTIFQFNQRKAVIQQYNNASAIPLRQNWLFWLSAQPLPGRMRQQVAHVFQYAGGKAAEAKSWMNTAPEYQLANQATDITLYKSTPIKGTSGQPVWSDGFGKPVLDYMQQGTTDVYRFYSRFNPAWNELVWNDRFPQIMFKLMEPAPAINWVHDRRMFSHQQLMPLKGTSAYTEAQRITHQTDLRFTIWVIVALLFLLERLSAHRTKTSFTHG